MTLCWLLFSDKGIRLAGQQRLHPLHLVTLKIILRNTDSSRHEATLCLWQLAHAKMPFYLHRVLQKEARLPLYYCLATVESGCKSYDFFKFVLPWKLILARFDQNSKPPCIQNLLIHATHQNLILFSLKSSN